MLALLAYVGKNVTSMAPPASGSLLEITVEKCSPYFSVLTFFMRKSASPSCSTFIRTIMSKLP